MGPALYHHHYHNAIVGGADPDTRYNNKWRYGRRASQPMDRLMKGGAMQGEVGSVAVGHFSRGQGGLFHNAERPVDLEKATDLFLQHEYDKSITNLGNNNDKWDSKKDFTRFKKAHQERKMRFLSP